MRGRGGRGRLVYLHASASFAEIEGQVSIARDILFGCCVRWGFYLDFLWVVVAPGGAVAAADGALAYVDVVGESTDRECDAAAVAFGKDGWACCWWFCRCQFGFAAA